MRPIFSFLLLILCMIGRAGTPIQSLRHVQHSIGSAGFEENKGQVRTTAGEAAPYVRFRLIKGNTQIFLLENGIAYQFTHVHHSHTSEMGLNETRTDRRGTPGMGSKDEQVRLETFRMDMVLDGADPHTSITTEGRSDDHTHYYNHDAIDVRTYGKVTYHDVYPGIDWVVYTTEKGMKYDFVVRPGADPDLIRLRFEHHEELSIDADGNLLHGNRMGRFTEERPVSFQDGKEVQTKFVLDGNILRFTLQDYDHSRTLTIDPERLWGTYYGGADQDIGWSCALDASGNVYMAGNTFSTSAIASGGHQNAFGGDMDAFLVKFNATGIRLWGTYYGGGGSDVGYACVTDASGNVYVSGSTTSATAIASGGHQGAFGGDTDAFLVKLTPSGTRLWSTYYGGPGYDRGLNCEVDAEGNVYLCGETSSTSAMASGGYQNTNSGGVSDAFLAKFNSTGTRLWGTYYGGSGVDAAYSCAVDANGNVYISGKTNSTSSIASGGHQNSFGGGVVDAFLAKFTSGGSRLWGTYYGGTDLDQAWQCSLSPAGEVLLSGSTKSTNAIANGGFQNAYGGGTYDGFIAKFNPGGTRIWGSYYGGSAEDFGFSCAVDAAGNSYLAGWTSSSAGIASNGYQNTYGGGGTDAFVVKLDPNGDRVWGTYFGGGGDEGGFWDETLFAIGRCIVNPSGDVLLTGHTTSTTGIAADGAQNIFGGERDAYLVKFIHGSIQTGVINGLICTGQVVSVSFTVTSAFNAGNTFTAQLSNASGSFANPVNIGSLSGTSSGTIEATIPGGTVLGTGYRIRVVASDPATIGDDNGVGIVITEPGAPCDDGNPDTIGDTINQDCICAGEPECSTTGILQEIEPNNAIGTATPLPSDTTISGNIGVCSPTNTTADIFHITPPSQGTMRVEACMSTVGAAPLNVTFKVSVSNGSVLATHTLQAGANGGAITSFFEMPCQAMYDYYITVETSGSAECMSYSFSYTTNAPTFENDAEPNNSTAQAIILPQGTPATGHLNFNAGLGGSANNVDYYRIDLPTDGVLTVNVEAEHDNSSTTETLQTVIVMSNGSVVSTLNAPIGADSIPASSSFSIPCAGTVAPYYLRLIAGTCGVSYRVSWTVTPPVFANDIEANNAPGQAIPLLEGAQMTGHLEFDAGLGSSADNNDYYRIDLPTNGILNVTIEAEHSGTSSTETITARLSHSTGVTLATWDPAVGAGGTVASTAFSINCRSATIPYYLNLISNVCGTSYRVSWTITPPVYANDVEPNSSVGTATPINLSNAPQTGQLGFDNQTDDDIYVFSHAGGPWTATVSAEHAGTGAGTMTMIIRTLPGTALQTFTVPAGGTSTPETNTFTMASLNAGTYRLYLSDVTCGVSYRIHCYDDDGDGVCNGSDVCAGGPEPGMPCDDGDPLTPFSVIDNNCACVASEQFVTVNASVLLDGAYNTGTLIMNDDLRSQNVIPLAHPYGGVPFNHGGSESIDVSVLAVTGDDAIVDWVLLELRDKTAPATVISRRAALVQRDGDVVDLDGNSAVKFFNVPDDAYYLVVRHRSHLGVMTGQTYAFAQTPIAIDLSDPLMVTYGSNAQRARGSVMTMWSGNANANSLISYSGSSNDRTSILNLLGASTFLSPQNGYFTQDVNMNGMVSYSGSNNDRTNVLNSLGASTFLTPLVEQLP